MFVACIEFLCTPEQKGWWLEKARNLNIIGCYAQTELGHGSNVKDLETTATLDMKTDEWVLHTPHIKATKFWPGQLGYGTHAIVFARMIIDGTDYGVSPFMVQVRNLDNHSIMPGIDLGDIGKKLGFNSADNGYASFNQVRIPRTHLLSRLAEVDKEGNI